MATAVQTPVSIETRLIAATIGLRVAQDLLRAYHKRQPVFQLLVARQAKTQSQITELSATLASDDADATARDIASRMRTSYQLKHGALSALRRPIGPKTNASTVYAILRDTVETQLALIESYSDDLSLEYLDSLDQDIPDAVLDAALADHNPETETETALSPAEKRSKRSKPAA